MSQETSAAAAASKPTSTGAEEPAADNEIRLVLVGKTGAGKSATGNTILGQRKFQASARGVSTAVGCQCERTTRFGKSLAVIDTPGVFDTERPREEIAAEVSKFLVLSAPGPHAVLLVTSAAWRFTAEETDCVKRLKDMFGEGLAQHLFLVITRTEDWEDEGITTDNFLSDLPQDARAVLKECIEAGRVLPFQNSLRGEEGEQQVRDLLSKISDLIQANGGRFYSEKNWQEAERALQDRIKHIMETKMEEERRKNAQLEEDIHARIKDEMDHKLQEMASQQQRETEQWEREYKEAQDAMQREMEELMQAESERLEQYFGPDGKDDQAAVERQEVGSQSGPPAQKPSPGGGNRRVTETSSSCLQKEGAGLLPSLPPAAGGVRRALPDSAGLLPDLMEQQQREGHRMEKTLDEFRKEIQLLRSSNLEQQEVHRALEKKFEEEKRHMQEKLAREKEEREEKCRMEMEKCRRDFERSMQKKVDDMGLLFEQARASALEQLARERARSLSSNPSCSVM